METETWARKGSLTLILPLISLFAEWLFPIWSKQTIAHGKFLEGVYKYIPVRMLPTEYLPDEYEGETPGTFKDIIGESLLHLSHVFNDSLSCPGELNWFSHFLKESIIQALTHDSSSGVREAITLWNMVM